MGNSAVCQKQRHILPTYTFLRENHAHRFKDQSLEARDCVLFSVVSLALVPGTLELSKSLLSGEKSLYLKIIFLSSSGSGIWEHLTVSRGHCQVLAESGGI